MSVRFNLINSIHNFINNDPQNQYFYYVFFILVIMLYNIYKYTKNDGYGKTITYIKLTITANTIFMFLLLLFSYIYIYYIFLFNFNPHINTKDIYIYIAFIMVVLLILSNQRQFEFHILHFLFNFNFNFNLLGVFFFIYNGFLKLNIKKQSNLIKLIHSMLYVYVYFSTQQIYNFFKKKLIFLDYNLVSFKVNNLINCYNTNIINNIYLKDNLKQNTTDYTPGNFKPIFEKNLI